MKIPMHTLVTLRSLASNSAVAPIKKSSHVALSSEVFEHVRHQVYGQSKKVDKIVVTVLQDEIKTPVLINRNVSTAFQCLNHISKQLADDAVLVHVSPSLGAPYFGSVNQPIREQADLSKIDFDTSEFANLVNEAYWRSCSLVTGAILKDSLDLDIDLKFNDSNVSNSFFSLEVAGLNGNVFSRDEMNAINKFAKTFIREDNAFECLEVTPTIAEENEIDGTHLVRIGNQVFSSNGPVIRSTKQIGRYTIFQSQSTKGDSVSIGGVSLPFSQPTSSYSWSLIVKNATQKFNNL